MSNNISMVTKMQLMGRMAWGFAGRRGRIALAIGLALLLVLCLLVVVSVANADEPVIIDDGTTGNLVIMDVMSTTELPSTGTEPDDVVWFQAFNGRFRVALGWEYGDEDNLRGSNIWRGPIVGTSYGDKSALTMPITPTVELALQNVSGVSITYELPGNICTNVTQTVSLTVAGGPQVALATITPTMATISGCMPLTVAANMTDSWLDGYMPNQDMVTATAVISNGQMVTATATVSLADRRERVDVRLSTTCPQWMMEHKVVVTQFELDGGPTEVNMTLQDGNGNTWTQVSGGPIQHGHEAQFVVTTTTGTDLVEAWFYASPDWVSAWKAVHGQAVESCDSTAVPIAITTQPNGCSVHVMVMISAGGPWGQSWDLYHGPSAGGPWEAMAVNQPFMPTTFEFVDSNPWPTSTFYVVAVRWDPWSPIEWGYPHEENRIGVGCQHVYTVYLPLVLNLRQ